MTGITNASPGILSGSIGTAMLVDGAVTTAKVADKAVTRAKLARDTLYSPVVVLASASTDLNFSHLGKTLVPSYESRNQDVVVNLTQTISTTFPSGYEVAVFLYFANSLTINFDNIAVILPNEGTTKTGQVKVRIAETGGMVALKKMYNNVSNDFWSVQGNVEVVE